MAFPAIHFERGGLHLPELGLWLDPHEPKTVEKVFVSHAHSDHVAEHSQMILSEPTSRLVSARIGGTRAEHILPFSETRDFGPFRITLYPAGHIFGSAMGLIESGGETLLYTGDFKLRKGLSAEACQPQHADILVMETTFGQPHYRFPPTNEVMQGIIRFCRESLDNDETPVLLGYSLGKSQEILCGLADAGIPIMLHGTVHKLTEVYQQFGQCFPAYEKYEAGNARGRVLLCPPNVVQSAMLRNLGPHRTAILTGWAVDPNCKYRYRCDAAFPLSDHADFPDLVQMVRMVQPRKVYTLHGFAADFAQTLRRLGYDAQALSQDEQLAFTMDESGSKKQPFRVSAPLKTPKATHMQGGTPFWNFADTCMAVAKTGSKLQKVQVLADFLRGVKPDEVSCTATWFSGRAFGASENRVLQVGWAVLRDVLCESAGVDQIAFHHVYLKHSDLGETAAEITAGRPSTGYSVIAVADLFRRLQIARGPLGKRPVLIEALNQCSSLEIKFLVKIITGDLRIGLKEGLVEEAVALAFGKPADQVREANLLMGDIGHTAQLAAENSLERASLVPFRPVKLMLASPEPTARDIWERLHDGTDEAHGDSPVWIEDKYDGIRCQMHKLGSRAALYSRDMKDVSATFPELIRAAAGLEVDFIVDGEVVAMRGDDVLPFAELQKRLGRKEADLFMQEEIPIRYIAFDALWICGRTLLREPLEQRRRDLEALNKSGECFGLARITPASSVNEIEAAFDAARARGNEGLMIKNPSSLYTPGRRGLSWLKLKKALATLDCVVIGAEYGHGKRSKVLSDYTFAVRDERTGELRTIGKAYTGLTDAEIEQLTQHFLSTAVRQRGRYFDVPPDTVLEIAFDKIQLSERHNSGLAMRFPRIIRIRPDKPVSEIDTVQTARKLVDVR